MLRRLLTSTLLLFLLAPAPAFAAGSWRWPVRGEVITPYRNGDDPYAAGQHRGIDIAGAVGDSVVAATGGEVRYAGALGSSGTVVSLRTSDGAYDTSYLHLSSVAVSRGQQVGAGDRLGAVGVTGERSAAAPHLHFGVREAGQRQAYLDPLAFLGPLGAGADAPQAVPVPHAAPAPVTAPMRVAPRSVPARAPQGAPAPQRAWRPFRAPAAVPVRAARRVATRGRVRQGLARRGLAPSPALARQPAVVHAGGLQPSTAVSHAPAAATNARVVERGERRPSTGPAAVLGGAKQPVHATASPAQDRTAGGSEGAGPDLGLVLAGLSLLAASVGLAMRGRGEAGSRRRGAYRVNRARSRPAHQP